MFKLQSMTDSCHKRTPMEHQYNPITITIFFKNVNDLTKTCLT